MSISNLFEKNNLRRGTEFPDELALSRGIPRESIERRNRSLEILREENISYMEMLFTNDNENVLLKDPGKMVRRFAAAILIIQYACDIVNGNDLEDSKATIMSVLEQFGVYEDLLPEEKELFENPDPEKAVQIVWTYESCRAICWALGLSNEDITYPTEPCGGEEMVYLLIEAGSIENLVHKCRVRSLEEILDMIDLYTRYDWACVEKRLGSPVKTGELDPEVVTECRRGLEWLAAEEEDWFAVELGT